MWSRKIGTYGNLRERKIFKSKILEGGGWLRITECFERRVRGARKRWEENGGKEGTAEDSGMERAEEDGELEFVLWEADSRRQPGGNGVKCSGNNEVFRCPTLPSALLESPVPRALRYSAFVGYNSRFTSMKLAHPIFSVSRISAPCGGIGEKGVCKTVFRLLL